MAYYVLPSKKSGGHVLHVPHQIAPMSLSNGENAIWPKGLWVVTVFVKTKLPEQLSLHYCAVNTHLDELVLDPPMHECMNDKCMNA